jgi:molecular chaperone GrpE
MSESKSPLEHTDEAAEAGKGTEETQDIATDKQKKKKDKDKDKDKELDRLKDASDSFARESMRLAEELATEKEKHLRLMAEYDNFRKRSQRERESVYTDVRADTVLRFLPVYDNLERAIKQQTSDEAYAKGVDMIMTQLKEIMANLGVSEINAEAGTVFDPELHDAVMHVEDESAGESIIVEEFQKGFKLGDKVIRFSVVKVAN